MKNIASKIWVIIAIIITVIQPFIFAHDNPNIAYILVDNWGWGESGFRRHPGTSNALDQRRLPLVGLPGVAHPARSWDARATWLPSRTAGEG